MSYSRREFFQYGGAAVAWMEALHSTLAFAQKTQQSHPMAPVGEVDSIAFWNEFFSQPHAAAIENRGHADIRNRLSLRDRSSLAGFTNGSDTGGHSAVLPTPESSRVEYVHMGKNGLRYLQDVPPEDLPSIPGDVMVSVSPGQFRVGRTTHKTKDEADFIHAAQLRLDIHQTQPFLNLLPTMAWTSLAAIFPKQGSKLAPMQKFNFTSTIGESAVNKILLPGGLGRIAVNVSTARKQSVLYTVLQDMAATARVLSPVLGLPAISIPALQGFSMLYAMIEQRTQFLMSSAPSEVAVTQDAWNSADRSARAMPMPPGDYLMYPRGQAQLIQPDFPNLGIENGYIVQRNADKSVPVSLRALQAAKGLTYVTMHVSATAVTMPSKKIPFHF